MEQFEAVIKKDDSGRLIIIELPFNAKEVFRKPKGTIFVSGTINDIEYRSRLLSRGNGRYLMVLNKAMQKSIGYHGEFMTARITMMPDELESPQRPRNQPERRNDIEKALESPAAASSMDVITAISTRQSIRQFTSESVSDSMITAILRAGLYAPTAKNKRPFHFVVLNERAVLSELAHTNPNAAMLDSAACAVVVCGDSNAEGTKEFLYADCAAAVQNMLLCIHVLGLGGVWCGVAASSSWKKLLIRQLELPPKMEPTAVIALGWPNETKRLNRVPESGKIHYGKW